MNYNLSMNNVDEICFNVNEICFFSLSLLPKSLIKYTAPASLHLDRKASYDRKPKPQSCSDLFMDHLSQCFVLVTTLE